MTTYNRASALLAGAALSASKGDYETATAMVLEASVDPSLQPFVDQVRASALSSRQTAAGAELRMDGPNLSNDGPEVQEGTTETAAGTELRELPDSSVSKPANEPQVGGAETAAGAELRDDLAAKGPKPANEPQVGGTETAAGEELHEVVPDAGQNVTVQTGSAAPTALDANLSYMGLLGVQVTELYSKGWEEQHKNDAYRAVSSAAPAEVPAAPAPAATTAPAAAPVRESASVRFTRALRNAAAHRRVESTASQN